MLHLAGLLLPVNPLLLLRSGKLVDLLYSLVWLFMLLLQLPDLPVLQRCSEPSRVGLLHVRPRRVLPKWNQLETDSGEGHCTAEQVIRKVFPMSLLQMRRFAETIASFRDGTLVELSDATAEKHWPHPNTR